MKILVVGSGLSGCVIADLYAQVLNAKVTIIDKRDHIGGNCYDYLDENNIRINKYGAHLFHTNNERVYAYVKKYGKWVDWQHKVIGYVDDKFVPIPVNIDTVNKLCNENITNSTQMNNWLSKNQRKFSSVDNGEKAALSRVGDVLYEKIFKHYTKKQWDKYPAELNASVLERIPVRNDFNELYFSDEYQILPLEGYTKWFENLVKHENINVKLNCDFFNLSDDEKSQYSKIFYTGPIDAYFHNLKGNKLPPLEYRSIDFEIESIENCEYYQPNSVVNYPSNDVEFTRIVEYKHFLYQESPNTTIVKEYSCDDGDPYYPVPNKKNQELYEKYKKLAAKESIYFVGRLANYKYFNMDQAILNAIEFFESIEGHVDIDRMEFDTVHTPTEKDHVVKAYNDVLRRDPDQDGLNTYVKFLKGKGNTIQQLYDILKNSDEYKSFNTVKVNIEKFEPDKFKKIENIYFYENKKEVLKYIVLNYDNFQPTLFAPHEYKVNDFQKIAGLYYSDYVAFDADYIFEDEVFNADVNVFSLNKSIVHKKNKMHYEACATLPPASWNYLFTAQPENVQLVVAKYKENVDWTTLFDDVIIYNKGPQRCTCPPHCVIDIENKGREGGTYLTHIITNYNMLAEYTIFCQACPFEHSPDFIHLVKNFKEHFNYFQPLTWRWKEDDSRCNWFKDVNPTGIPPIEIRNNTRFLHISHCKIHMELLDQNFNCVFPLKWEDGGFNHHLIPRLRSRNNIPKNKTVLQWVYDKLDLKDKPPLYFPFCFAANFGVHRENVMKRPVDFYKKCEEFLLEHEDHGYLIERLWAHFLL